VSDGSIVGYTGIVTWSSSSGVFVANEIDRAVGLATGISPVVTPYHDPISFDAHVATCAEADLSSDASNCGACGVVCGDGQN
jgi:hypothetical protein